MSWFSRLDRQLFRARILILDQVAPILILSLLVWLAYNNYKRGRTIDRLCFLYQETESNHPLNRARVEIDSICQKRAANLVSDP